MTEILLAVFPAVVLLGYLLWVDRRQPEPFNELLLALLGGVGATLFSAVFSVPATIMGIAPMNPVNIVEALGVSLFGAGLPEELAKLIILFLLVRRNKHFDERLDGIVYAACVGLGFAAYENIMYVAQAGDDMVHTAVMRGLLSVPGHFSFGVLMGYWFSKFWWEKRGRAFNLLLALAIPVAWHTLYDWLCFSGEVFSARGNQTMAGLLTLLLYVLCFVFHKFARSRTLIHQKHDKVSNVMNEVEQEDELQKPMEIYSFKQILLWTLLTSPVAGLVMLSRNCTVFGDRVLKNRVWMVGIIGIVTPLCLALYAKSTTGVGLVPTFVIIAMAYQMRDVWVKYAGNREMVYKSNASAFFAALVGLAYTLVTLMIVTAPIVVQQYRDSFSIAKHNTIAEFAEAHDYNVKNAERGDIPSMCYLACEYWDRETHADSITAQEWLDKAISESDTATAANNLNNIAYYYANQEKYDKALALLDTAIRLNPDEPNLYDSRGEMLFRLARTDEALEMYNEVLARDPQFFEDHDSELEPLLVEAGMI